MRWVGQLNGRSRSPWFWPALPRRRRILVAAALALIVILLSQHVVVVPVILARFLAAVLVLRLRGGLGVRGQSSPAAGPLGSAPDSLLQIPGEVAVVPRLQFEELPVGPPDGAPTGGCAAAAVHAPL